MKLLILPAILCLILTSCGAESSPEGRMGIKIDNLQKKLDTVIGLQQQIDSLKLQNAIIIDSLGKVSREIKALKK
jgi:hypothetical protein